MSPWNAGENLWKIGSLFLYVVAVEIFSRSLCEFSYILIVMYL